MRKILRSLAVEFGLDRLTFLDSLK